MSVQAQRDFNKRVRAFTVTYHMEHGKYPTEAETVKAALYSSGLNNIWSTNLFLPLLGNIPSTVDSAETKQTQKLLTMYNQERSPQKKRALLDKYPQIALHFGISTPDVFQHNQPLWDKFNVLKNDYNAQVDALTAKIVNAGTYTADDQKALSAIKKQYSDGINALKIVDANWPGNAQFPKGQVNEGEIIQPGPWTLALSGDPLATRGYLEMLAPGIPKKELDAGTVGGIILHEENTLAYLNRVGWKKLGMTEQTWRDTKQQINQKLDQFRAYPKTAIDSAQSEYYKSVNTYRNERTKRNDAIKALHSTQDQQIADANFASWRDQQDHPVVVDINGKKVTFPSPVRIGWSLLPPAQKAAALAKLAGDNWGHLASYEKELLGVPRPPRVAEAWAGYHTVVEQFAVKYPGAHLKKDQKLGIVKALNKQVPGFLQDYQFSLLPKVDRFEYTSVYKSMPSNVAPLMGEILGAAKTFAKAIRNGSPRNATLQVWRTWVEDTAYPEINKNPAVKAYLAQFDPKFLTTLLS